jgi:hypothetical protein
MRAWSARKPCGRPRRDRSVHLHRALSDRHDNSVVGRAHIECRPDGGHDAVENMHPKRPHRILMHGEERLAGLEANVARGSGIRDRQLGSRAEIDLRAVRQGNLHLFSGAGGEGLVIGRFAEQRH